MKIKLLYILPLVALTAFSACRKDDKVNPNESIFLDSDGTGAAKSEFDIWLQKSITYPYNIEMLYKYDDVNTSPDYILVPAKLENAQKFAQIIKYAWLEAYDETAGLHFTRQYAPKQIVFIGSRAINRDGSETLATAEGGVKVTVYKLNDLTLTPEAVNKYFHIMHHEFSHILHQTKNYTPDFGRISETDYLADDWINMQDGAAQKLGFVSAYAMNEPNEDFAETYSLYITSSDEAWKKLLSNAGATGSEIILRKLQIIRDYIENSWGFNLESLRANVLRRTNKVPTLDYIQFNND